MDFGDEMSDKRLLERLRNGEDGFVERKVVGQQNKVLRVAVSFANSAPIGMTCVIFLGVNDDGKLEDGVIDTDDLQKKVNRMLQNTYPRVPYQQKELEVDGKKVLAVVVIGSELRPHFAGPSYVRRGSESIEATTEQLDLLIAQRGSKVYRLSTHIGKRVTLSVKLVHGNGTSTLLRDTATIIDCNESWVTVNRDHLKPPADSSFPLERVVLGYDSPANHLQVFVTQDSD